MAIEFLYRGFNSTRSKSENLEPRNPSGSMELGARCGDKRVQAGDSDFSFGLSISNAIHLHEYMQNGEKTGYLSFSPYFDRAKYYALGDGKYEKGTVLKVSVNILREKGFKIFSVNELLEKPACKEDDEHSVYVGDRIFPQEAIVEEIIVYKD